MYTFRVMRNLFRAFFSGRRHAGRGGDEIIDMTGAGGNYFQVPRPGWRVVRLVIGVILAYVFLRTSIYQIGTDEVGIILRLGRYTGGEATPGLNFKLPFGIDLVYKVPVQRQLKQEFGFRTAEPGIRTTYQEQGFEEESLMLTGDLNAADVEWIVQYRIKDPYKYLFKVRNVAETFHDISEAVVREVVGDRTVNEVLTIGRQDIADQVGKFLQGLCDQYEMGLGIDQVVLQDVTPPNPVKPSFNEVNQAQQEREKLINQARAEYNQVIPKARGEAEQTIQQAEGYAADRVNRARGEASRFLSVYEEYRKAPAVTRQRLYLETMGDVLPRVEKKIILDDKARNVLPLLNLGETTQIKEIKSP